MDNHAKVFMEEAYELVSELERSLLELEERPRDQELIDRVFRAMHTIKGSSSMFGFDEISGFTHEVESVLDLLRDGVLPVTKELISLSLLSCDLVKRMLDSSSGGEPVDRQECDTVIVSLKKLSAGLTIGKEQEEVQKDISTETENEPSTPVSYWIRFRPSQDIFLTGTNPVNLLNELRALGDCKIVAQADAIPPLAELDPEKCYTYWDIVLTSDHGANAIKDVFIFVEDDSDIRIEVIDEEDTPNGEGSAKRIGEILVDHGDLQPEELQRALGKQKRIGQLLVEEGIVDLGKVQSALKVQEHCEVRRKERQKSASGASIRVASTKLDYLVDLVGELVTVQSRLSQLANTRRDAELLSIAEEVERLTAELRDNTMSIRMVQIGSTFGKFKRLVRDLADELGKNIEMVTEGGETDLDKTVIDRLNDPLVHLIRNCIDHGIEPPEVRRKSGKAESGTVTLSALHSGGNVLIKIEDDGAGMDANVIRAKAIEKGILRPDTNLSEKETFSLIFAPGFSTVDKVTNVSGRGVGMDVVKQTIEELRGSVEISSRIGIGTTITLKLPLTLAIIEGLLVRVESDAFVMPLTSVEECVELSREGAARTDARKVANVRGEIVPYINLREHFGIAGEAPTFEQIVVGDVEGKRVGFVVDEVVGEHQTVLKSLGRWFQDIQEISGATILGDGGVALIVDIPRLVKEANLNERTAVDSVAVCQ